MKHCLKVQQLRPSLSVNFSVLIHFNNSKSGFSNNASFDRIRLQSNHVVSAIEEHRNVSITIANLINVQQSGK